MEQAKKRLDGFKDSKKLAAGDVGSGLQDAVSALGTAKQAKAQAKAKVKKAG